MQPPCTIARTHASSILTSASGLRSTRPRSACRHPRDDAVAGNSFVDDRRRGRLRRRDRVVDRGHPGHGRGRLRPHMLEAPSKPAASIDAALGEMAQPTARQEGRQAMGAVAVGAVTSRRGASAVLRPDVRDVVRWRGPGAGHQGREAPLSGFSSRATTAPRSMTLGVVGTALVASTSCTRVRAP